MHVVHAARGAMACGQIQHLGIPGSGIVPMLDCLSFGPAGAGTEGRAEFWRSVYGVLPEERRPDDWSTDAEMLVDRRERLLDADRVVIWSGASLDDGLAYLWLLSELSTIGVPRDRIYVIHAASVPGSGKSVSSLDMLPEATFREYLGTERPVTTEEERACRAVWDAFLAPEPGKIMALCRDVKADDIGPGKAFCLIRRRYPLRRHGLPAYLADLLNELQQGPVLSFELMARYLNRHLEDRDCPGDQILESALIRLAADHADVPLVEIAPRSRGFVVSLTDAGHAVVRGEANNIDLNGIDQWIGGVHLSSGASNVWVYAEERGDIARYPGPV